MIARSKIRRRASGMTLIEVLIAVAVFAVVTALSAQAITRGLETKQRLDAERRFWTSAGLAWLKIQGDAAAARPRPVLSAQNETRAAWMGQPPSGESPFLEFSTAAADRAPQRVAYSVSNGTLWRTAWPSLDLSPLATPQRIALLTGVKSVSVRYDGDDGFIDRWPSSGSNAVLPHAVEFTIQPEGRGAMTRAFLVHA